MGKLVITDNYEWKKSLTEELSEGGFRLSGENENIVSFHKLNMNNCNFYKDGNDCVACAGTFIYREELGEKALSHFLEDARKTEKDQLLQLRNNAIGMYVVAVRLDDVTYIFVDNESLYQFFYYSKDDEYLATSTIYHIAQHTNAGLDLEEMFKYITVRGYYDRKVYFEGCKKLDRDELIVIDGTSLTVEEHPIKESVWVDHGFKDTADKLEKELRNLIRIRKKVVHKSILYLTGGVDSRLEYAMSMANGEKVTVGYWLGRDMITNGRTEDARLSKRMAEMYGNEFKLFNVSEKIEFSYDAIDKKMCNKYGEWAASYANNTKWKKMFENLDRDIEFINFGAITDTLRDYYNFDKVYKQPYTFEQFVRDEFCRYNVAKYIFKHDSDTIYTLVGDAVKKRFVTQGMNLKNLSFEDCARMVAEKWYVLADGIYNFANMFCYSFPTTGMKQIHDIAVPMSVDYKRGSRMSIELTGRFCSRLLDVPYFSAHCYARLNKKTGKIKSSLFSRIRRTLIRVFSDSWLFQKIVVGIIANIIWPHMRDDKGIFEINRKYMESSSTIRNHYIEVNAPNSVTEVDVSVYSQTVAFFLMLDQLCKD